MQCAGVQLWLWWAQCRWTVCPATAGREGAAYNHNFMFSQYFKQFSNLKIFQTIFQSWLFQFCTNTLCYHKNPIGYFKNCDLFILRKKVNRLIKLLLCCYCYPIIRNVRPSVRISMWKTWIYQLLFKIDGCNLWWWFSSPMSIQ